MQKMLAKNKTVQKYISALLIVFILAPSFLFLIPQKTNAQTTLPVPVDCYTLKAGTPGSCAKESTSWLQKILQGLISGSTATSAGLDIKQWVMETLKQTLRIFAKNLLKKMTESTINWINSGFHGSPLFLENPESFFKDIAKYEIKNLVGTIGYDNNRFPFGKSFSINIINAYKSKFEQNAQYSLSKVTNDPELLQAIQSDFNVGGWDGFLLASQYPQNNAMGSYLQNSNQLAMQLKDTDEYKNAATKIKKVVEQGGGFLSPEMCTGPNADAYNKVLKNAFKRPSFKCSVPEINATGCGLGDQPTAAASAICLQASSNKRKCLVERHEWEATNTCVDANGNSLLVNTTPGSVVGNQVMKALGASTFDSTVLAGAMGNSLSAIFDALIHHFMDQGLNALSSAIEGKADTNTPDDFDYYGNRLDTTVTGATNILFDWTKVKDKDIKLDDLKPNKDYNIVPVLPTVDPYPALTCPAGQTGTPPDCEVPLGPPDQQPLN